MRRFKRALSLLCMVVAFVFCAQTNLYAVSAKEIDSGVDQALKTLREQKGAGEMIKKAKGILAFPGVFKAGIGIGGEYGEGALRIGGRTAAYYSTAGLSIGLELGGEKKSIVLLFMTDDALKNFRNSDGWKIGTDASVAVITLGAAAEGSTATWNKPIIAYVFGEKGLMYDLSLNGMKVSKINR